MQTSHDEMLPEYDFKNMRVRKMGLGRKSFCGIPNPDYVGVPEEPKLPAVAVEKKRLRKTG